MLQRYSLERGGSAFVVYKNNNNSNLQFSYFWQNNNNNKLRDNLLLWRINLQEEELDFVCCFVLKAFQTFCSAAGEDREREGQSQRFFLQLNPLPSQLAEEGALLVGEPALWH